MRIRTLLLAVLVLGVALFAALNWATFTAPTALSLGVATVHAPLGLIMLILLALVAALFLGWVIWLQGSVLLETRRQARELQAQRDLADKAEASRFTELMARLDAFEQRQRAVIEQTGNSLSAFIGELEDRLEHGRLPPDVPRGDGRPR
ncbi:MAG TPA: LapA family protein [Ideonella sp.]|nr:LapA family protein [Ideonella sp.]